jgi:hypothetical protein
MPILNLAEEIGRYLPHGPREDANAGNMLGGAAGALLGAIAGNALGRSDD